MYFAEIVNKIHTSLTLPDKKRNRRLMPLKLWKKKKGLD
jgi:hypothetical protein